MITPIDIDALRVLHRRLLTNGVRYGYGVKAPSLTADSSAIRSIDCSGYVRYLIAKCTNQQLILPDGSQSQREWAETHLRQLAKYPDVVYANPWRLFICFIKPNTNGCGDVGHVWLVTQFEKDAPVKTIESHGGKGVDSRAWDYSTLRNEVYSAFELPVK